MVQTIFKTLRKMKAKRIARPTVRKEAKDEASSGRTTMRVERVVSVTKPI